MVAQTGGIVGSVTVRVSCAQAVTQENAIAAIEKIADENFGLTLTPEPV
jgi:hypothetical protein